MASTGATPSNSTVSAPGAAKSKSTMARGPAAGGAETHQINADINTFADVQPELMKALYESHNPVLDQSFGKLEASTGLKREQMVYGIAAVLGLYLIFGGLAQLICNLIGFAYPAYASVKAVRTTSKDDDTQWLIYWCVFATFSLFDFFADAIMSFMPIYWVLKVIFLLYLALPQTKGAIRLYYKFVNPAATKIDAIIANYMKTA